MSDEINIEGLAEEVTQILADDKSKMDLYKKIDDAVGCVFTPDEAVTSLPWVQNRHYAMTNIADARNAGARTFSTLLPNINIQPTSDDPAEYEGVNMAEQALLWDFSRMNRGGKNPHEKIVESALTYHRVCFETRDLPHMYKGREKDPRVKAILRKSRFQWNVHHPGTVHARISDDATEKVAKVACYSAQTLIDQFGKYNPGIEKMLEKHKKATTAELMKIKYTLVDCMDWEYRTQWAVPGENLTTIGRSDYVFMNKEHKLPFIPWVIMDKGDPLWQSVLTSGTWENLQYLNLIEFAKAIEQSTRSTLVVRTPDGTLKNIWIDFSNPTNPIVLPLDGSDVSNVSVPPIDPQLSKQKSEMSNSVMRSTVSSVIQDIGQFADAPFSTVNQIVQMALGQLAPAKNCAQDAEEEGLFQQFQWMEYTDKPLTAYYTKDYDSKEENGKPRKKGQKIFVFAGNPPSQEEVDKLDENGQKMMNNSIYVNTEDLYIDVELQADNQADEQARMNLLILAMEKMGMSRSEAWERMGWNNKSINDQEFLEEALEQNEIKNQVYLRDKEIQDQMMQNATKQVQAEMEAQQKSVQQKNTQGQINELNSGNQMTSLEGRDMRSGSQPAAQVAPLEGVNQITGTP